MSRISGSSLGTYPRTELYITKNEKSEKKDTVSGTPPTSPADRLEKSAPVDAGVYSPVRFEKTAGQSGIVPKERTGSDLKILHAAIEQSQITVSRFKEMVASLLYQQAEYRAGKTISLTDLDLTAIGVPKAAADELVRLSGKYGNVEAAGAVGQDDYFGVDATAKRIFDFAVSLSGGDPETMEMLKGVVQKAFKECEKLFGGTLPDISYQTLDRVNSLFCDFEKQSQSPAGE
ncbi:MAG TPA: hypothetical protein VN369_06425 [Terriglobales bacterium]|nr:hypothetical protein [Terriglobales bacterium]